MSLTRRWKAYELYFQSHTLWGCIWSRCRFWWTLCAKVSKFEKSGEGGGFRVRNFWWTDLLVAPGAKPKVRLGWLMRHWKALTLVYGTHTSLWGYHPRRHSYLTSFTLTIWSVNPWHFKPQNRLILGIFETLTHHSSRTTGDTDALSTALELPNQGLSNAHLLTLVRHLAQFLFQHMCTPPISRVLELGSLISSVKLWLKSKNTA